LFLDFGKDWLDENKFWVIYSGGFSTSFPSSLLSEMTFIVDCKFFIEYLLRSKTLKENFLVFNILYWLFNLFIVKLISNRSDNSEVSKVAEFLRLK